jgi:undecaprenyl-diphosphatase
MSIPVILGAAMLSSVKAVITFESIQILPLMFGVLSSAITGYLAISVMLKVIKKGDYTPFCIYLILVSIVSLISGFFA